ncbi:hypothetical protein GCM10023264_13080 [Sphingomonas daechungensis]|uniref:Uncharacterized protein n=1 Tax=Sphingomonas daechungensis TaxID=1176646 RepID=A0ABX6SYM6_9SPHN|nr:hypothetical protein [Sphingomonas daechungensis]QNP42299.1 hypothetical protein H9L15_08015 [Sphingomonas daechungensis]
MAKIVLNPRVPNRIRKIDFRQYANGSATDTHELTRWYENGDLIILSNYRFQAGREVFHRVPFPNKREKNKLILTLDEARHGEAPRDDEWAAALENLEATDVSTEEFRETVRQANDELLRLSDQLFPHYRYSKRFCIYNLTEMLAHNMHFDSPQHAADFTQLRAFVNIDTFPRIWRIGGTLEEMVGDCYHSADLKKTIGKHPRMFSRQTTLSAFGDRYESGAHPYPMHSIAFQPGEVWFLNPNMLAHEVVYGRRIMDGVFLFEASGLQNPKRFYPAIVDRLHRKHLGPLQHCWRRWRSHEWLQALRRRLANARLRPPT